VPAALRSIKWLGATVYNEGSFSTSVQECPPLGIYHHDCRPRFLFGVGAQKSGTTWLYEQLSKHPAVGFGWKKEIGLWGSLWDKNLTNHPSKHLRQHIQKSFYRFPNGKIIPQFPLFSRQLGKEYFKEFRIISDSGKDVVADITPHYSAISGPHFLRLRRWAEDYGFDPRVVFIMRDPVERVISGVMHSNRRLKNRTNEEWVELIEHTYDSYPVAVRTRYDKTLRNIESAFETDQVGYFFFEELFTEKAMDDLSGLLGISAVPAIFSQRVRSATRKVNVPLELRKKIRSHYDPVYLFCKQKFGEDRLSSVWKNIVLD
jgi:hypothetical protein